VGSSFVKTTDDKASAMKKAAPGRKIKLAEKNYSEKQQKSRPS
jgi:hypothetical protein